MTALPDEYAPEKRTIKRVGIITNPESGNRSQEATAEAAAEFVRHGVNVTSATGLDPDSTREIASWMIRDRHIDAIVVSGGDGLIHHVLQSQAGTDVPMGIIPAGTGNDFAHHYGLPRNPVKAARLIAAGKTQHADLGIHTTAEGVREYFATITCCGFDSRVNARTNRLSWPKGTPRYVLAVLLEALNFHGYPAKITLDHKHVLEQDLFTTVAVGITSSYGGGMKISPDADHTDGLLDITVIYGMSIPQALKTFPKIFRGEFSSQDGVNTYHAKHVRVELEGAPVFSDGDFVSDPPIEVDIAPAAGLFFVP
ncbi:diacylglycerol kinase family protein [Corynebacterium glucuronolyticum]|uniref:diacylglycerol kinase family protein n=1 Tax=Corynebacterium glucuronolyticum TaxID=39791 RepID=UPI00019C1AFE|nr:diacylglycerol kinase family protein [Corynebacterium glucuronolyticum]EEI27310.1 lipid kinase, YegS/Rv2252/BmrU family [Corynebacterium glucuronolyticum ATCC 51867]QRO83343.1 diacylglycerol kinase [Corynebacterium glucuronolyticum]